MLYLSRLLKQGNLSLTTFMIVMLFGCGCDCSLQANGSLKDKKVVSYKDFGARGDGKTCDMDAIAKAHEFANKNKLPVRAEDGATYYISGKKATAIIQTDTDFGTAKFIIDDTEVEDRRSDIFKVLSDQKPFALKGIASLKRNQTKLPVTLPQNCLVSVANSNVKHYIRFGLNQNNGNSQTDIFLVDKDGNIDMKGPIIWDFDQITEIKALPIDESVIKISGGHFTTIANVAESKYTYYHRGINIGRSNVTVDGLKHYIQGEGEHGAPYRGFLNITNCTNVTIKNAILTGHKTYQTIGSAGKPVSMGSYDVSFTKALNVSFINCRQSNDIKNRKYWGVMGSNYSKNILLDKCVFSRFDAHKGVANATIRNSKLGYMGINAIGTGKFVVEGTTIYGRSLINLRPDYGSTWDGSFIIRNCTFIPACGRPVTASLIGGYNSGQHDFGYTCYMPAQITIENLHIDDSHHPEKYRGPAIFSNFNWDFKDATYVEKYPYIRTKVVNLKNVTTASGKSLRVSDNAFMFKDVKINK